MMLATTTTYPWLLRSDHHLSDTSHPLHIIVRLDDRIGVTSGEVDKP